jgi:hypothetical protein
MTRSIVTLAVISCVIFAVLLSGCQTQAPQQHHARGHRAACERRATGLGPGVTLAEMRGADAATIDTAREHSMLAFAVARDALAVDLSDLTGINSRLRLLNYVWWRGMFLRSARRWA